MASITRVNGDIFSGINQSTALGSLVSLNGAQPQCFSILLKTGAAAVTAVGSAGGADNTLDVVLRQVQNGGTIIYYQIEATSPFQISVMVERSSWTAATLQAAIRALGASVGTSALDVSGTTVADAGFKLV